VPDGTLCLDATVCDGQETCQGGECAKGVPLSCDDGVFCNGRETCDAALGCQPGTPPAVDDGVSCTVDGCNDAAGAVEHIPDDARCHAGYACSASRGCQDIDECANGTASCGAHASCSNELGTYSCPCDDQYEQRGGKCVRWCTPRTVGVGVQRCVRILDDGTVTLHTNPDFHADENFNPSGHDSKTWGGRYSQSDEAPNVSYCGPTAGKNLLYWYGLDTGLGNPPYTTIGAEMHTNTWDGGLVFGAAFAVCTFGFFPDPICIASVDAALSDKLNNLGTLPADLQSALNGWLPAGYDSFGPETFSGSLAEIRLSLLQGNPVVLLESEESQVLHWALITGIEASPDGDFWIAVANAGDRQWSELQVDLSLGKAGDAVIRAALANLGLVSNTMYRWGQRASSGTCDANDDCCHACAACAAKTPNPGPCGVCASCR
jgi:hypothetical protein